MSARETNQSYGAPEPEPAMVAHGPSGPAARISARTDSEKEGGTQDG